MLRKFPNIIKKNLRTVIKNRVRSDQKWRKSEVEYKNIHETVDFSKGFVHQQDNDQKYPSKLLKNCFKFIPGFMLENF